MKYICGTVLLALSIQPAAAQKPDQASARPPGISLVLVLAVDQMRADYLTRFQDQFSGGFRYLAARGRIYTDAHQEHSCTLTAVGHSTILTGAFPSRSGIIGNDWYDRNRKRVVPAVTAAAGDGPGAGARIPSPRALHATTLGDWLQQQNPNSKVFTISRKDRAAIMLGGQHPSGVFWYAPATGTFTTSEYYANGLPGWALAYNSTRPANKYFNKTWERVDSAKAYTRSSPDDQEGEGRLMGRRTFPYRYSGSRRPTSEFYSYLASTPFMDEMTLELAERAVRSEQLGKRGAVDLLGISLSTTDSVGHTFGPHSQEIQDMMLRLDRMLDRFFKFLDKNVDLDRVLIVLTGDHGVAPLPEVPNEDGVNERARREATQMVKEAEALLQQQYGPGPWIEREYDGNVYLNQETIRKAGVAAAEVENQLAQVLRRMEIVEDVFTRTELTSGRMREDPYAGLFAACFNPDNSGDLMIRTKENVLSGAGAAGTTHGSPYRYDTHVPLIFAGPGITPGRVDSHVRTVDIAPTIAAMLGIPAPEDLDGRPLGIK